MFQYALQSFGLILLLAILIRFFLFSSYAMSGSSMLPTVWPGDFLVGSRVRVHDVQRGDVVALRCPQTKDKLCLRRVVALPGDRVEFHEGFLVLNGQQARHNRSGNFAVELVGGKTRSIWPEVSSASSEPVVVPPKSVYLLNDKRGDHDDSRTWGSIGQDLLEARIVGVWMSIDWFDGEKVRVWPRVRFERLFHRTD